MMSLQTMKRVNDDAVRRLNVNTNESPPPFVPGDIILVVYCAAHNRVNRTYLGKTGPFMHDKSQVNGWTQDEMGEAVTAAAKLQDYVGLDSKVAVDRK